MSLNIEHIIREDNWLQQITPQHFDSYALALFHYQYEHCTVYRAFADAIGRTPAGVKACDDIPFLPISFFKTHTVVSGSFTREVIFESSGTTTTQNSRHLVKDASLYRQCFLQGFVQYYGAPEDYVFLCLLPSYLERGNSSLVYMADELIRRSGRFESGFYLNEWEQLASLLGQLKAKGQRIILLGVTFALLDFAEHYPMDLSGVIVMETGGMKGRREEWTREQVHQFLCRQWQLEHIHSEYGMTELLSQAYSKGDGIYRAADTMQVRVRDENDPFEISTRGAGCLNVIDLANVHSCAFIATDDIARIATDGSFEVMGRLDHSALRGCSLMVV
ncbi:LuxE/PaaK family acyltransferase [Taibaiella koreensis]|uniref:LuxE/PaaK family acyltransferase n=1 Tax=Taibaiella koreensis TaxID=1268548 RepID=UPI000E5998D7|nr:acyl transferase [Taibaiella koreensis]